MMDQARAPMPAGRAVAVTGRSGGRALLAIALVATLALPTLRQARADDIDDLRDEVEQLKQQVLYLQNQVPGGGVTTGGGNLAAQQEVRMQQLQQQMSDLTGQIERVELKVNDLAAQVERMQKDYEYRLGVLEGTGAPPPGQGAISDGAGPSLTTAAPQSTGAPTVGTTQTPPAQTSPAQPSPQPGVLGTLTPEQAANLPQAPAGAAEAAAAQAAAQTPLPTAAVVLPGETPREQYEYATNLIQRGAYDQAEIALKSFIEQHPKDELTGNAQYWLGETYYVRNDFKAAAVAFAEGYQKYPNSQKAADNLLKLAMALGQQGQKENACVALKQLEKRYPDASANIKDRAIKAKQRYSCS